MRTQAEDIRPAVDRDSPREIMPELSTAAAEVPLSYSSRAAIAIESQIESLLSSAGACLGFLLFVCLLCYGYKIFGFHITIDEEIHADYVGQVSQWFAQGRWGMGLLSAFFLPSTVVPVVSPMLCIGLSATAWFYLLRNVYSWGNAAAVVAVSVGISVPMLAFTLSFSALAYGVGIANVCLVVFAACLLRKDVASMVVGALAGAFAIAVYQSLVFALLALCLFELIRNPRSPSRIALVRVSVALVLAIAGYYTIDVAARQFIGTELSYVGSYLDVTGFFADPWTRFSNSLKSVSQVYWLGQERVGLHSPWLSLVLCIGLAAIVQDSLRRPGAEGISRIAATAIVLVLPVFADAITSGGAPLRSGIYYSVIACLLVGFGYAVGGATLRSVLVCVAALAVVGDAMITNRLAGASATAYQLDRNLAYEILLEVQRIEPTLTERRVMNLEVVGSKGWAENRIMPKRETFGASFFEWEGGNRYRVAAFLRLHGLTVVGSSEGERVRLLERGQAMPAWPLAGWVAIDGETVIVKFSKYSAQQGAQLCAAGSVGMCAATR